MPTALTLVRFDERPILRFQACAYGIVLNICDCPSHICLRIKKHLPAAACPRRGQFAIRARMIDKWMHVFFVKSTSSSAFQCRDHFVTPQTMCTYHQVSVVWHDRAGVDRNAKLLDDSCKASANGSRLYARELYWLTFQSFLSLATKLNVMGNTSNRMPGIYLSRSPANFV